MNTEISHGVQTSPSGPIVPMIVSSTKSTIVSARLRTPRGAFIASLPLARMKIKDPMTAARQAISAILLKLPKMFCQRMTSLMFGNSSPSTMRCSVPEWRATGGRA
jgi:hypothetical protein